MLLMDKDISTMKNFYCNLHTHTTLSDGTLSEDELIYLAIEKLGSRAVLAITDHDAVSENIKELIKRYVDKIVLIPGCEVSVRHVLSTGRNVHIHLNFLFFDMDNSKFKDMLKNSKGDRDGFLLESLRVLEEKTLFRMTLTELKEKFKGCEQIGRKHIAACLVEQGLYKTDVDALDNCIGRMKEPFCYVDASTFFHYPDMETAINIGKDAHALIVLNHPLFFNLTESELKELIHSFVMLCRRENVPCAMEIEYSAYSREERNYLYSLKEEYKDLMVSCGSDFHGFGQDEMEAFPGEYYLKLKDAHKKVYKK